MTLERSDEGYSTMLLAVMGAIARFAVATSMFLLLGSGVTLQLQVRSPRPLQKQLLTGREVRIRGQRRL